MSTKQMSNEITSEDGNLYNDQISTYKNISKFHKVDINILMDRVRAEKKKEKKENIIFLSLIASVILITGVIASL
tara:strand:- start:471 stop:695 length:225 start_codon:yes stop_codon:yes gene_type:complete